MSAQKSSYDFSLLFLMHVNNQIITVLKTVQRQRIKRRKYIGEKRVGKATGI
jgi:hypothetical protein